MAERDTGQRRILTGMRPSGRLHLGHYAGALQEWKEFDASPTHECIFLVADMHTLGDKDVPSIVQSIREVVIDWMAVGLDPEQSYFSLQSGVPEINELTVLLLGLMNKSELDRNPTLKHEMETLGNDNITVGFYIYPALQVGDILAPQADLVPVGDDQIPHIEFTRRVARRFNNAYGETFPVPSYHLSQTPRLVGTDGNSKMGKSLGNTINLSDSPEVVTEKVMGMFTDPNRLRATDPGTVEGNPVFIYHNAFNPNIEEVRELEERYRQGRVGDVEVKRRLIVALNNFLDPIRERRAEIERHPEIVEEALRYGTAYEKSLAQDTVQRVRDAMGLWEL